MRERGKDRERIRGKMIVSDRKCDRERECVSVRERVFIFVLEFIWDKDGVEVWESERKTEKENEEKW